MLYIVVRQTHEFSSNGCDGDALKIVGVYSDVEKAWDALDDDYEVIKNVAITKRQSIKEEEEMDDEDYARELVILGGKVTTFCSWDLYEAELDKRP